jgi:hypothetical protein
VHPVDRGNGALQNKWCTSKQGMVHHEAIFGAPGNNRVPRDAQGTYEILVDIAALRLLRYLQIV